MWVQKSNLLVWSGYRERDECLLTDTDADELFVLRLKINVFRKISARVHLSEILAQSIACLETRTDVGTASHYIWNWVNCFDWTCRQNEYRYTKERAA